MAGSVSRKEWRERRSIKAESARAGMGDEGEDGCEFPQAAGVLAVLESVVVSFGCAGAGPAASSRHGRPPMVGEGYADLWVGDGRAMEGPRLLTRKTTTPASTRLVRLSGCFASAAILGDPHACLRRLTEVEGVSAWGLSVRRQRSTAPGDGCIDSTPWLAERGSPGVTGVES